MRKLLSFTSLLIILCLSCSGGTDRKKKIYAELTGLQMKAAKEAEEKYPTVPKPPKFMTIPRDNVIKNTNHTMKLQQKYRRDLLQKYGITEAELNEILIEGLKNSW